MSKPFIVVSDGFNSNLFKQLQDTAEFEVYPESKITQDTLKELLPKINGIVIRSATKMTKELIDLAPNLKYIIRAGEGTDNIDKAYCQEKGIKVSNTPGANSNAVAELAIAFMLGVLRKTAFAHKSMHEGKWEKALFGGAELTGKKVGFAGFGKIGQLTAKRLAGFDVQVKYYDVIEQNHGLSYVSRVDSLEEMFKECDIISIHLPKIESTINLVNKDLLSMMKPGAIIINTSRGGIINEDDLYTVLKEKSIRGAALDVYSSEPLDGSSKLLELDNLLTTPHVGASSEEAQYRVGEMAVNQLKELFLKDNLVNEVRV